MDNLTHSLAGVVLGRTMDRREGAGAAVSVWTAVLAVNLPDLDVPLLVLAGDKSEFMVHHRGWTHTLLASPFLAALAVAIVLGVRAFGTRATVPMRRAFEDRLELRRLFLVGLAGALLHLLMDALNNYGVHPFAPLWSGWLYGDSLFIVEPLLQWSFLPFVVAQSATLQRRAWWLAGGLGVLGVLGLLSPLPVLLAAAGWGVFHAVLRWKVRHPAVPWASAALVAAVFVAAGVMARARAEAAIAEAAPGERVADLVSTPAPANPLCWRVMSVGADGEDYVARVGSVSLGLADPATCFPRSGALMTAELKPPVVPSDGRIAWRGEFRTSLGELRKQNDDCRIAALLGFVRVPFWGKKGHRAMFGDLRYDVGKGLSFAEVVLDNVLPKECPSAPWSPPRADLLEIARSAPEPPATSMTLSTSDGLIDTRAGDRPPE